MSTIDDRIVDMKFQNSDFMTKIKSTLDALGSLKTALNMDSSRKSLEDLDDAGKKFSLQNIASATDGVSGKFVAMATVAITALASITSKVIDTGVQMVKSLSIDPLKDGLSEYETNLNAIQTILANTSAKGTTLDNVNGALQELNTYSDKTIYNFSEMARNIGTFTAAGVDLDTSVNAIKGIANLAAVSGSNSQQASTAMYQLSQALATGTVKLMDWNSVVNAGMGGEVFQNSLKETARAHGVAVDQIIKDEGSFRDSLQKGWLTSDILTETLSKFTGDLNADQLRTMGYNEEQIAGILKMGQTAQDAATKVKTMSQLVSTLQEAQGSGWAQTWQLVFGDFDEAKELFTNVNNVLGGMISASAAARNGMLKDWKDLGGRTVLIEAVTNAFNALMKIVKPIKDAFQEIFPPATGKDLYNFTQTLEALSEWLTISDGAASKIGRTFKGFFALLDIGVEVVKQIYYVLADLLGETVKGSSGILDQTAAWGDWLVSVRDAIKSGEGLSNFFDGLRPIIKAPIIFIRELAGWFKELFSGDFASSGAEGALDRLKARLEPISGLANLAVKAWGHIGDVIETVWNFFRPLADEMSDFFGSIGKQIADSVKGADFSTMLDTVNTALLGGITFILHKFLNGGFKMDFGGGFLASAKEALEGVTSTLQAMQTNLKADTLIKIAGAIGILTLSVVGLSLIDSGALTKSLTGLTVMFVQLGGAMAVFEKIGTATGAAKLTIMAAGLTILSVAILGLTASVKVLSTLDWEELGKGMAGLAALLGMIVGVVTLIEGKTAGMVTAGAGLLVLAAAIKVLTSSVKFFSEMDWGAMGKGLAGVAALLLALGLFTTFANVNAAGIASGVGILLIAAALRIMVGVVQEFSQMSWGEIGKSLVELVGVLAIVAAGMIAMTEALPGAAALIIVAAALQVMNPVLQAWGQMEWGEIGKSLVELVGALGIIALAMIAMTAALPGAAALIVVAGALAILTPVLIALGNMSWDEILHGLVALGGAFLVIGAAGLLLGPVVPVLIGLGAAIALIGVGVLAAGVGLLAFSAGLTALSVAGAAGTAAMVAMVGALIGLIPQVLEAVAQGIVLMLGVLSQAGPQFLDTFTMLISTLLQAIDTLAPQIIDTLTNLILDLLDAIVTLIPEFVDAGMKILIGVLDGIADNIGEVVDTATDVAVNFIDGISRNLPRIIQSGFDLLISFLNGIEKAIRDNSDRVTDAGMGIGDAIVDGVRNAITKGVGRVVDAAKNLGTSALNGVKNILGIHSPSRMFYEVGDFSVQGLVNGLNDTSGKAAIAGQNLGKATTEGLKAGMAAFASEASTGIELNPTIRPVVDMTDVKSKAGQINDLLSPNVTKMGAVTSFVRASSVQSDIKSIDDVRVPKDYESLNQQPVTFNQYNTSPKALSQAEIYRQTKNQLSLVRGRVNA